MSNHLHILLKITRDYKPSRSQVADYYFSCYGKKIHPNSSECFKLAKELNDISKFMQRFARDFAFRFNRECKFKRTGHLWAERFHSTLIQDADSLLRCWKYVIFNPVKAGMTDSPLDYKFNSLTFEDKEWCEKCMEELYAAYQYLTDEAHEQSLEEFTSMLMQMISEEVKVWKRLNEEKKREYRKACHFWDKACAVGNTTFMSQIQVKFGLKYSIHQTATKDCYWL